MKNKDNNAKFKNGEFCHIFCRDDPRLPIWDKYCKGKGYVEENYEVSDNCDCIIHKYFNEENPWINELSFSIQLGSVLLLALEEDL